MAATPKPTTITVDGITLRVGDEFEDLERGLITCNVNGRLEQRPLRRREPEGEVIFGDGRRLSRPGIGSILGVR